MLLPDLENFIKQHIVRRQLSLCKEDIERYQNELHQQINGKYFLVIGGAGTIGSNYIKAILPFSPKGITVLDYNENGLTELIRDLRSSPDLKVPGDVLTYAFDFGGPLLNKLLNKTHFDSIACFAAHKHVRSEKDVISVEAMITNNIFNTKQLLDLAVSHQPDHVFAVSTDKAANPVNIMGCTKKLMEKIILVYSSKLHTTTARFANVAFSNGSLLDGFTKRLANHQPLSAPNDVKRYFVTPEESGEICMMASLLGNSSDIFFPKLEEAEMKTFSEIADSLLITYGLIPDHSQSEEEAKEKALHRSPESQYYPVYYFKSDTSGEKLFEEFYGANEELDMKSFHSLGVIKNPDIPLISEMEEQLNELRQLFEIDNLTKEEIVLFLKKCIPDFEHLETGKNLDSKM